MKPRVVGSACYRVQQALEEAMSEGGLDLVPELAAHAARCPRCGAEVRETEELFALLRGAAAGIDMTRVPHAVDYVIARTALEPAGIRIPASEASSQGAPRGSHLRWVVGQVAVAAAIVLLTAGGLSYTILKVNEAVSGTEPTKVVDRLATPFRHFIQTLFPNAH